METILLVGGAGYIGSHVNKALNDKGYRTLVFDSLITGHRQAVKWGRLIEGDMGRAGQLRLIFKKYSVKAVLHLASFIDISESVAAPEKYYLNNVINTLNLLNIMKEFGCRKLVFSSTCATYGLPEFIPITEQCPQHPVNPYGRSKLMVENILKHYSLAFGFNCVSLRYFNAAGADPGNEIGEAHRAETHLIPLVLDVALGRKSEINVFGNDYPTGDGTCVRDYVHVTDLAQAHVLALEYLLAGHSGEAFNLSNDRGISVNEVVKQVQLVTGRPIEINHAGRRPGDPPILVGCSDKIKSVLGWAPQHSDLKQIIKTAWAWHQKHFGTALPVW